MVCSPYSPRNSQESFPAPQFERHQFFSTSLLSNSHLYMTTGKTIALTILTFVGKVISLHFNTLSRFVIAFLPRSECLNFVATVTINIDFGAQSACYFFFFNLGFMKLEFITQSICLVYSNY